MSNRINHKSPVAYVRCTEDNGGRLILTYDCGGGGGGALPSCNANSRNSAAAEEPAAQSVDIPSLLELLGGDPNVK